MEYQGAHGGGQLNHGCICCGDPSLAEWLAPPTWAGGGGGGGDGLHRKGRCAQARFLQVKSPVTDAEVSSSWGVLLPARSPCRGLTSHT